jgi:hydrogenase maturation protein HypF
VSQHVGDLETAQAFEAFRAATHDLPALYDVRPDRVGCDLHPDYVSTRHARSAGVRSIPVQHHVAHVLACMAENQLRGPVLGVSWDGTGYGADGTVWGGELLRVSRAGWERVGHLRTFPLPGGDLAVKEPRRTALGLLFEVFGDALFARDDLPVLDSFRPDERRILRQALARGINCPRTSSAGRLFDAVAAMLGLRLARQFEGQAAMELEWAIGDAAADACYPFELRGESPPVLLDWGPLIHALLDDRRLPVAAVAARFHNTLVEMIVAAARRLGERDIVLTGGCFQNRYLTERTVVRLRAEGFTPHWHQRIPPNDGGIALGQVVAATMWDSESKTSDQSLANGQ